MMNNFTITDKELRDIHNGMCMLDNIVGDLEDVIHPDWYKKLLKASKEIRSGFAGVHEQESKQFDEKCQHYDSVRQDLGLTATWSIYEITDLNKAHPFGGAEYITYSDHWGKCEVVKAIAGLTWSALYMAANAAIRDSGDEHHTFIEKFTPIPDKPGYLNLSTGS